MARIIRFNAERHQELRDLLPWYATDQLSAADCERVEAHLETCSECRDEVHFEHRLEEEVSRMPIDVDQSWARMREKIATDRSVRPLGRAVDALHQLPAWSGWAAAVAAVAIFSTGFVLRPTSPPSTYTVLSSRTVAAGEGNVAVIFRPDTPERVMRQTLLDTKARLVDGPTATGGYVLRIAPAGRDAALAKLRSRAEVELAEAVESGNGR